MGTRDCKDLLVWKKAHTLALKVYNVAEGFPKRYQFDLTSQIKRAALSVPTNIAEGCASLHTKEFVQFLNIANRSAAEVKYLLKFSFDSKVLVEKEYLEMTDGYIELQKMICSLMYSIKSKN